MDMQSKIDAGNAAAAEFLHQQRSKHLIPAGKSTVTVEKGIYFTRQGRYRPKSGGKWVGSFYTLDGAREALKDYEVERLEQQIEILKKELEALKNEK